MFLDDSDILQALANNLGAANVSTLSPRWSELAVSAHQSAYQDIVRSFIARGFTQAQIDQWDSGAEFERDLSLFWALTRGGSLASFDKTTLDKLDRRNDLRRMQQMCIGGVWYKPGLTTPGQAYAGIQDRANCGFGSLSSDAETFGRRE